MLSRRSLLAQAGASAAALAFPTAAVAAEPAEARARRLVEEVGEELLQIFPERATGLGLDTGTRAGLRGRLSDSSAEGQRAIAARLAARVREVEAIDTAGLTPATRIDLDVIRTAYATALNGFAFDYGDVAVGGWRNSPYVVIQNVGSFIDMPRLFEVTQKLETPADTDAYLARLEGWATVLDAETARLRDATGKGVIPPAFLLDKAVAQLRVARGGDVAGWTMVKRFAAATPAKGPEAARIVGERIVPALDRQIAALEAQRRQAGSDAGVWRLPQGEVYYRWALAAATTTERAPEDIHAQGLEELKRYQAEMDALLRPLGYTEGSVGKRMAALGRDPRYLFPNDDKGRAQVIAYAEGRIAGIRPHLPQLFGTLVPGNVVVTRIPAAEEPGAAGAYGGQGSADGTIPGRFWINLASTDRWPRFSIPSTTYHEAIPGHVWQGEYTLRQPIARTLLRFSAHGEGWALYAEQLADEVGVYEGEPAGRLGYLQSMAFRACRLVVDTGLHAKRWSREQAIRWFAEENGQSEGEVTAEVERYCSWPGQACAYKVGHSEINRLRDKVKAALGARYDRRAFNDAVLAAGPVPLTVLARAVDAHVAAVKA